MKTTLISTVLYLSMCSLFASPSKEVDSCYYINTSKDTIWKYGGVHFIIKHPHQILVFDSKEKTSKQKISADTLLGFGKYEKTKSGKHLIHYRSLGVPDKQSMCMHLQEVLYDSAGVCIVTDWRCTGSSEILVSRLYVQNQYMYTIDKTNWGIICRTYFPGRVFPFSDAKVGAYPLRKYFTGR